MNNYMKNILTNVSGYEKRGTSCYAGRGQNMVLHFCKRFLFYSGIIVYTISRIVPECAMMIRLVTLKIYSIFYLPEVRHF